MKFKLDENLGQRCATRLRAEGRDVSTVSLQRLGGAPDETIFRICEQEGRALITLDFDFAQVLRFPPERSSGIVIIRNVLQRKACGHGLSPPKCNHHGSVLSGRQRLAIISVALGEAWMFA